MDATNRATVVTIGTLSARFAETVLLLSFNMDPNGELLMFQKPRMQTFPDVGFYGYSHEFERNMAKSNEAISAFNPSSYTADDLMRMYRSSISVANYHRISAEHQIGSNFKRAAELYRAVIEFINDEEALKCLEVMDKNPGSVRHVNGRTNHAVRRITAVAFCGLAMVAVRMGDAKDIPGLVTAAFELDPSVLPELHAVRIVALSRRMYGVVHTMAQHVFLRDEKYRKAELSIFDEVTQKRLIGSNDGSMRISMSGLCH
jgi:hypothetical protein